MRQRIASSLLKHFESRTSGPGGTVGLTYSNDERERFMDLVRMLEAACFFEPENASTHAQRISTRWGWWMDFGDVSSKFWSAWRRSEEWGKYAQRFGLSPVVQLPFPYTQTGIAGAYEASIQNLSSMLGVYNKHQAYGFPSGVPKQ